MRTTMYSYILYYFMIGTISTMVIDYILNRLARFLNDESKKFSNMERTIVIVLWPIYTSVFIWNFIIGLRNKNK